MIVSDCMCVTVPSSMIIEMHRLPSTQCGGGGGGVYMCLVHVL